MMKKWITAVLLVFLCGCFKVKDELTLQPDGSGTVHIETQSIIPNEMMQGMGARTGNQIIYPPTAEAEARKFFPGDGFQVSVKEERKDESNTTLVIDASFKDINVLLSSPYARAHALGLKIENNVLSLKAATGMETSARFAEIKDESGMYAAAMPGLGDMDKKKMEMKIDFKVNLPNAVSTANGAREGKSVTWSFERAKAKDAAEFAAQTGELLEAACPADGLKFAPVSPVRLGQLPFSLLRPGPSGDKIATPDTAKIAAAVQFTPYALSITRSLDLTGQGQMNENEANLLGAFSVPESFAPQKWGEVKLQEVVDAQGKSLKPETKDDEAQPFSRHSMMRSVDAEDEDAPVRKDQKQQRMITLTFRPPDWKVTEISRIKGSISLQYFGSTEIVKLTNAIPASWIVDPTKGGAARFGGSDANEKNLKDAKLTELGMELSVQIAMIQSGAIMLMLQMGGEKAVLSDIVVFDADGKSWPTILQKMDYGIGMGSMQVYVPGRPKAPLSLALAVSGVGASVEVPILLEHVPVSSKSK